MTLSPNDRRISIENLPLSVERALKNSPIYDQLVLGVRHKLTEQERSTILDLLTWLKTELT